MSRDRQTEALLRQFNMTDGPKGTTEKFRTEWERIFGQKPCTADFPRFGGCDSAYPCDACECTAGTCHCKEPACELCGNTGRLADAPCPRGCAGANASNPD